MNFQTLALHHGITFLQTGQQVTFTFNACGHAKSCRLSYLRSQEGGLPCLVCKRVAHVEERYGFLLDPEESTATCLDCRRCYRLTPKGYSRSFSQYKCYCTMKRAAELEFFDLMNGTPNFYRSYNEYGVRNNYSSDFHIRSGEKVFIIHLDDDSHRIAVNAQRDRIKLGLCLELENVVNVYVDQRAFRASPNLIHQAICDIVALGDPNPVYFLQQDRRYAPHLKGIAESTTLTLLNGVLAE
jgi:hypothetical protein